MARKKGLDLPNALYYVQLNSSARKDLFQGPEEYGQFTPLLEALHERSGSKTVAWCLLKNSIHLLLKSGPDGIIEIANGLKSAHKQQIQGDRSGALFSTTNHCTLVEPGPYLLDCIRKIHRLPLSTGLVPDLSIYPWSSHSNYLEGQGPAFLEVRPALNRIANQRAGRRKRYENFMRADDPSDFDWLVGTHPQYRALSSEEYVQELTERQKQTQVVRENPADEPVIDA